MTLTRHVLYTHGPESALLTLISSTSNLLAQSITRQTKHQRPPTDRVTPTESDASTSTPQTMLRSVTLSRSKVHQAEADVEDTKDSASASTFIDLNAIWRSVKEIDRVVSATVDVTTHCFQR